MKKELQSASVPDASDRSAALAPGDILQDRYRIVSQLGRGGMGAVYEAVDQRLDATVALKETFSVDARLRRQFEQEARLLAQLNHPALPRVSDYFTEGDRAFLVMQFISGVDLAEIIAKQPGPFPRNQVVAWADQLLDALVYLHTRDRQIIHRDIKPHNLKLTSSGKIALLDFGLAKADSAGQNSSASIFGYTRRYAPLEQIQDQGTTPQSDIYALGATLYHLLTGVKPVDALARAAALVNSKPDPLMPANDIHRAVGPEISAIICCAMALNPDDRFASASDFREALWRVGRDKTRLAEISSPESAVGLANVAAPSTTVSRALAGTAGMPVIDAFDGYFILKPKEPEWFLPAQKREPRAMAGIVLLLLITAAGTLYGYRHWIGSGGATLESVETTTPPRSSDKPLLYQNKADSPRYGTPIHTGTSHLSTGDADQKVGASDREQLKERPRFRLTSSGLITAVAAPTIQRISGVAGRQVAAPNPRLPNAEIKESGPSLSVQRLPAFGQPEVVSEKQVLRAPDGTQVVKFSDGTTRVFRPGEKVVPSGVAPQ